ncbi:hypothetical protein [Clostridium sp.]|uniref:hypothetical protein n=1 Tax=Clostridium sp. TaxID=1506 RepID=UPI001A426A8A|nr:hypothetical protein [Clostridium sp.]MBK5237457.1 hypothetical protein [Clostridium sp.]
MKKIDIKRVIDRLEPDKEMEHRLSEHVLQKKRNKFILHPIFSLSASLVIIMCIGILGYNFVEKKPDTSAHIINSTSGIDVPKIELQKNINVTADMIGLIVYQGRVYTQSDTKISSENAENLLGEKLGTTKENIDEWSQQDDYAVEFASNIGKNGVYSVKGYDKSFRIMTYEKIDGTFYSPFYDCINGITVKTGADVFNKLKIENNTKTAKYENLESWNDNKKQYKELTKLNLLNNLINELKNTIPNTQESLSYLFDDKGEINQKFIYITLNDGSEVPLRLFKDGYIYYSHIFFKVENQAFNKLWNELN